MQPHRHFCLLFATLAILFLVAVSSAGAAQWYVSTTGASTNAGTLASPWSLEYALEDYTVPVAPGDTIWILPGDYYTEDPAKNRFSVNRRGDSSNQITIRNYQNGRVTLHGRLDAGYQSSGSFPARNVTFWGLEMTNRDVDPNGTQWGFVGGSWGYDPSAHTGLKLINCVLHDCGGSGIDTWRSVDDFQAVGNLVYFNGRESDTFEGNNGIRARCAAPLGAGHGQLFKDNLVLSNFGFGARVGVVGTEQEHIVFDGDVFMKAGEPSFAGMSAEISFEDASGNALQPVLNNIYTFMPSWGSQGGLVTIDFTTNAQINGGYFYSTFSPFSLGATNTGLVMNNNTIVGTIGGFTINQYGTGNTLLATAPASGKKIVVRPNDFETGRANIIIYNWDQSATVSVDISSSGMVSGWQYEVLDAQNFYAGPVATGTYTGAAISIPMTGLTAATPVSPYSMVPQHTAPEFGLFIVRPVNNPPVVTMGAAPTVTLPANTATLSATVTDDALPAGQLVTVAWTQVSGPATATIANASALSTLATFPAAGTYIFRITASDSAVSAIGDLAVQVLPASAGSTVLHLPFDETSGITAADASGYGRNGTLFVGSAPGSTLPVWTSGHLSGAVQFNGKGETVRVPSFPLNNQFSVAFWFKPAPDSLDANHDGYHYIFSYGNIYARNNINVWFTTEIEPDLPKAMRLQVLDNDDAVPGDAGNLSFLNADAPFDDGAWHHFTATIAATGTRTMYLDGNQVAQDTGNGGGGAIAPPTSVFMGGRCDLNSERVFDGGMDDVKVFNKTLDANEAWALAHPVLTNLSPVANAGPDKYVMLPYALALGGAVSDDGLPTPPATCTASWTKVSGPGVVTFTNPSAAATNATFSAAGTYVLRLTASDSALVNSDDKTVIVLRAGDFTGDGRVDGLDFLRWQSNYPNFIGGATPDGGDGNNDGKVDGLDFLVWQSNYGG